MIVFYLFFLFCLLPLVICSVLNRPMARTGIGPAPAILCALPVLNLFVILCQLYFLITDSDVCNNFIIKLVKLIEGR